MLWRGFIARWKTRLIEQIPAGDPADEASCACGDDILLTESYEPIQTEFRVFLRLES